MLFTFCCSASETNFFPLLKVGEKTYTNARIARVTASHAIVLVDGGGASVPLSNLPAKLQKQYGYNATAAASAEEQQDKARAQYEITKARAAHELAYIRALDQSTRTYQNNAKILTARIQAARLRVINLKNALAQLRAARDQAWNNYIYTDSDVGFVSNSGSNTEGTRLAHAQSIDRQITQTQEQIFESETQLRTAESDYRKDMSDLAKRYQDNVEEIHETFRPTSKEPVTITGTKKGTADTD